MLIKEYRHWKVLLRKLDNTLGNCFAITKEHRQYMSEVTSEEMAEFAEVSKDLEGALKASFNYDSINYLVLMRYDKHVHYHIIPRYEKSRQFAGQEWVDDGFPGLLGVNFEPKEPRPLEVLLKVKEEIQKNI